MFVNPKSGLQAGKIILEGGVDMMVFEDLGKIFLANVLSPEQKQRAFARIKEFQSIVQLSIATSHSYPYIVIAGGDGSFMSTFGEVVGHGIDPLRANFCLLPFGTGNDLAQLTGWGGGADRVMKDDVVITLKFVMQSLRQSIIRSINIWEIEVTCAVLKTVT